MSSSWLHLIRIHSSSFPSLSQSTSYSHISPECQLIILFTSSLHSISLSGDYIPNACSFNYKPSFRFHIPYYIRGNLLWCLHRSWTCFQQLTTVPSDMNGVTWRSHSTSVTTMKRFHLLYLRIQNGICPTIHRERTLMSSLYSLCIHPENALLCMVPTQSIKLYRRQRWEL